ncbi:hypothetical protein [Fuerstiella marisgermanici]|uniref:EF hand n=1 Tax=Fuerstiella marisgermanici TaxID=1891926 RepID=A0A1P8WMG7_9PLAN|nr:hypothetical protein [Fuerstiella marisgermanici]APZ95252.1 EF hand [Fuerstiella marisgermanici]
MRFLSRNLTPWTLLAVMSFSASVFGQVQDVTADKAAMVILAPEGPVFAELRISVDGEAYRLWVTKFLASKTDIDRNGELSLAELELIPARLLQQTKARTAQRCLQQSAGDKNATSVSVDRFTTWLAGELSKSFDVTAAAIQASEAVRLASLIDQDGDGNVSREELADGTFSMRFRDLDDDQTFSASELMPFRDPRNQQAAVTPDVANLPFVQLSDTASIARTADQLANRYGDSQSLPVANLRLPPDMVAAYDLDKDSKLSVEECRALLKAPPFHLTANILLSDRPNRSDLKFEISEHATAFCTATAEPRRKGRVKLIVDEMQIDVRARGGSATTRSFLTSFILQRFSVADGDKNGYVTEDEFSTIQQQLAQNQMTAQYADVDLNGDEMLFRDELKMFIERDAIATQSKIEVTIRQDGKTLFKLLDANVDRRLSQRELLEGFNALLEYDVNGDQRLSESELGTAYALNIGLGQAQSFRVDTMQTMGMEARSMDAILPGLSGLSGPDWFRRMDRNQDRDVSIREFLGPREIFDQLDRDHDGLLSASEAEALDQ